jgi:hypothetical protein
MQVQYIHSLCYREGSNAGYSINSHYATGRAAMQVQYIHSLYPHHALTIHPLIFVH